MCHNINGSLTDFESEHQCSCQTSTGLYDNIFMHIWWRDLHILRKILESTHRCLKPNGVFSFYVTARSSEVTHVDVGYELARGVNDVLPATWLGYRFQASFAGGLAKRRLRLMEISIIRHLKPTIDRLPHLGFGLIAWPIIAALTALNNFRLRNKSSKCPEYCTSVLLTLTKTSDASSNGDQG